MSASHDQKAFEARDYYELLGVAKDSTGKQITKAYRKTALRYHPDHNRSDYATAAFQHLTRVHQVLTKDALRKMYDRTGSVEDEDMQFEESYDHWRSMFPAFSMQDVEEFQAKYVGGAMEKEDVLGAYREAKGDMQVVIDSVPYCSLDDAGRFAEIIEEAGLANALFRKSLKALEKNRGKIEKHAATEAKEAEELAEELGLKKKKRKQGSQSSTADAIDLALIIRQRQKTRESAFDSLLDKYEGADEAEGKKKQGKGKKRKKKTAGRNDEPPESAFARTAARKNRRT